VCFFRLIRPNRRFIVGFGFTLHKRDCLGRAYWQAVSQTVAVIVPQEPRFSVNHADCALVTGSSAQPAAVALCLVDFNNIPLHNDSPLTFD
jgi:hypothetical protein